MKKLLASLMVVGLSMSPAWAVPNLQLDIAGNASTYDTSTDTILSNSEQFTLLALLDNNITGNPYYISAAIVPKTSSSSSFGSFKINNITYSAANMVHDVPPLDETFTKELPKHDIYPTHFAEIAFSFNLDPSNQIGAYDTQTGQVQAGNLLFVHQFLVDTTGLDPNFEVHFDLYDSVVKNKQSGILEGNFAPFSHDAQSSPGGSVPDGGTTALLLGLGFLGIASFRKLR